MNYFLYVSKKHIQDFSKINLEFKPKTYKYLYTKFADIPGLISKVQMAG